MGFPWRRRLPTLDPLFSLGLIENLVHCTNAHRGGASIHGSPLTVKMEPKEGMTFLENATKCQSRNFQPVHCENFKSMQYLTVQSGALTSFPLDCPIK